jgi:hypothetical protein
LPVRYSDQLSELCADVARHEPQLSARAHRGRGSSPALPAARAHLAATTLGCLDSRGLAPRSHQPSDRPEALDPRALDDATQFGLILIDALDAYLAARRPAQSESYANPAFSTGASPE